jgi:hypothetical protein
MPSDLDTLHSTVQRLSSLLRHFESILSSIASGGVQDNAPNPLHVLRDASSLLKAHTTKLSLLLINPPFTASAITSVLRSCEGECLPAMMAAYEITLTQKELWPTIIVNDIKKGLAISVTRFGELLSLIGTKCHQERQDLKPSQESKDKEKQLVFETTGQIWKACDGMIEFAEKGIPAMMARKVETWRETIKDAIEELKEWGEGDEDELGESSDGMEVFGAANNLPEGRKDIEERLEEALRRLRLVATLYQALVKRRIRTFPSSGNVSQQMDGLRGELDRIEQTENVRSLDRLMEYLEKIPDAVDELASGFYDLDTNEVDRFLEQISSDARAAASEVRLSWDGKEDEFTGWARKWDEAIKPKTAFSKPD